MEAERHFLLSSEVKVDWDLKNNLYQMELNAAETSTEIPRTSLQPLLQLPVPPQVSESEMELVENVLQVSFFF